jgi:ATP synthase subunit 6
MFINSVLEQFDIIPLVPLKFDFIDFSITNQTVLLALVIFVFFLFFQFIVHEDSSLYVIPSRFQVIIEMIFKLVTCIIINNIDLKNGQRFFPLICSIFLFVLMSNIIGLIPYSFTVTSHFVVTFGFAIYLFLAIIFITVRGHGVHFFELFLPGGTPILLALILVPVEVISYVFKPISLSIRLFANMMAGHTLLKVISWFAFALMNYSGALFILHMVPLVLLVPLFALEFAVALIQALVFSILISIYLNEAVKLH